MCVLFCLLLIHADLKLYAIQTRIAYYTLCFLFRYVTYVYLDLYNNGTDGLDRRVL